MTPTHCFTHDLEATMNAARAGAGVPRTTDPDETPVEIVLPVTGPAGDGEYDDDRR